MKLKILPFEVDQDDPFKGDALGRSENASVLTQLIKSIDEPFVLGIDSGWGTGKTTFVKMWMQSLKNNNFPCLYFNAWENDFSEDPLISLIGEIQDNLDNIINKSSGSKAKKYFNEAKKLGYKVAKKSIPIAIKIATSGIVDLSDFAGKDLPEFFASLAKEKIVSYEKEKKTLQKFKATLQEFVSELIGKEPDSQEKLIFFIDELDRCRPTFAIELLEKVKHLFSVKGIIFVLSIDKKQIIHAIKSIYGIGMDAGGYLRRFIDLSYRLPQPTADHFISYLFSHFGLEGFFDAIPTKKGLDQKDQFIETFIGLSDMFKLSLRVQEQCFTQFTILLRTTPKHQYFHPILAAALIIIKAALPKLYENLAYGEKTGWEVVNYLKKLPGGNSFLNTNPSSAVCPNFP